MASGGLEKGGCKLGASPWCLGKKGSGHRTARRFRLQRLRPEIVTRSGV